MKPQWTSKTYLTIRSAKGTDLDCDFVTEKLALHPDRTWHINDRRVPTGTSTILQDSGGWQIFSEEAVDLDPESQIISLLDRLNSRWGELVSLGFTHSIECGHEMWLKCDHFPPLGLSRKVMQQLTQINADFYVDLYRLVK